MKNIYNLLISLFLLFSVASMHGQYVKVICIGNSITQGSLDTTSLKAYNYKILKSWRYPFWFKMDSAGVKFDMIGSQKKLYKQDTQAANYPKSNTMHVFDSAHEARWGATSDSIKKAFRKPSSQDTADIALIHIGGSDNDTNVKATIANIDTIVSLLRTKNAYVYVFLAKVISGGVINDSIATLATRLNSASSPVTVVDLTAGWNGSMTIDGTVPDSVGEKFIAQKFYNAVMNLDVPTTINAPTGIKQTCKTIHSMCISWNASVTPALDIFTGYDIYANNEKKNKYLIKNTTFNIQNLDIVSQYDIKVVAIDARTNTQKPSSTFQFSTDGFKVDFIVKYNSTYVKDAKITFNSLSLNTGTYGEASFTGVAPGKRSYTVTKTGFQDMVITNQDIKSDTTFYVNLKSVALSEEKNEIKVFPNPSKGIVTIENAQGSVLELSSLSGLMLESVSCKDSEMKWDISKFESGTYIITIKKGDAIITRKIVLAK